MRPRGTLCSRRCPVAFRVAPNRAEATRNGARRPRRSDRASTFAKLTQLAGAIAHRVCRHLTHKGWLEGEDEFAFLSDSAGSDDGMDALRTSSITFRIATGAQAGRKVVTLQTIPADADGLQGAAG